MFLEKLKDRVESLTLTMISKKVVTGVLWSIVTTWLLVRGYIGEQTWSMTILVLIGTILGIQSYEKVTRTKITDEKEP